MFILTIIGICVLILAVAAIYFSKELITSGSENSKLLPIALIFAGVWIGWYLFWCIPKFLVL